MTDLYPSRTKQIIDLYPSRIEKEEIINRIDKTVFSKEKVGTHSLSEEELQSYEKNGFILFPDLFSKEEVEKLKEELIRLSKDKTLQKNEEFIKEPNSNELRTIFNQHLFSKVFDKVSKDSRILDKVRQLLGSDVYIHHSRVNIKPAYKGKAFPWHSDFETWHTEDGLPNCRCLTAWIMLTDNTEFNGPLFLIKGSHKKYISCKGFTPDDNYKNSLRNQMYGVPSANAIEQIMKTGELTGAFGKAGTLVIHDGNVLHGSCDNMSPYSRTNSFFVYNSTQNRPVKPFGAKKIEQNFYA